MKAILDVCYKNAVDLLKENLEDMDKVVSYLLAKETITGGEMVAILEGRDPATVESAYASTMSAPTSDGTGAVPLTGDTEPPARNILMISQPVEPPAPQEEPTQPEEPSDQEEPKE